MSNDSDPGAWAVAVTLGLTALAFLIAGVVAADSQHAGVTAILLSAGVVAAALCEIALRGVRDD